MLYDVPTCLPDCSREGKFLITGYLYRYGYKKCFVANSSASVDISGSLVLSVLEELVVAEPAVECPVFSRIKAGATCSNATLDTLPIQVGNLTAPDLALAHCAEWCEEDDNCYFFVHNNKTGDCFSAGQMEPCSGGGWEAGPSNFYKLNVVSRPKVSGIRCAQTEPFLYQLTGVDGQHFDPEVLTLETWVKLDRILEPGSRQVNYFNELAFLSSKIEQNQSDGTLLLRSRSLGWSLGRMFSISEGLKIPPAMQSTRYTYPVYGPSQIFWTYDRWYHVAGSLCFFAIVLQLSCS